MWAAPGRVNLIGEHTDYNDGLVAPLAIDLRTVVAGRRRDDDELRLMSLSVGSGPVTTALPGSRTAAAAAEPAWARYVLGVLWVLREAGYPVVGMDLLIASEIPMGAGLSSSAALECAVGLAAVGLGAPGAPGTPGAPGAPEADGGAGIEPRELARLCRRAENDVVGAPSGPMDQLASMLGRTGHALLLDTHDLQVAYLPFDLAAHGLELLVVDTGETHQVTDSGREHSYRARVRECGEAARLLGVDSLRDLEGRDELATIADELRQPLAARVRHVLTENDRVREVAARLGDGCDPRTIGPLLTASHASLRDDFDVSSAGLDLAVSAALAAGAHGARMTGAGFGGSAIALVDADHVDDTARGVQFAFSAAGMQEPAIHTVRPAGGAGRLTDAPGR
jgi:galactokinase